MSAIEKAAPVQGLRVIEISQAAASVAGRYLADLGAEVIKIEPEDGEASRRVEPLLDLPNGESVSSFWLAFNVGKKSVCVDLETAQGQAQFVELARSADIVITDFERLTARDSDDLAALARAANPALVWTEIWPFGRGQPCETYSAGDLSVQALG
ncbi:MAG: CoA transferase, partial [Verrucomicrobiaceae bacterium]